MLGKRTQGRDEGDLDRGEELQSVFENERYVGIWGGVLLDDKERT